MPKKEFIKNLVKNKVETIEMKKAEFKKVDPSSESIIVVGAAPESSVIKALSTSNIDDTEGEIKRTIIGNTYNWMDSHNDVHVGNTFRKSIKERGNKIFHLHDHVYQIAAKVGVPSKIYEKEVNWKDLGVDISGTTTVLMMDSTIKRKLNENIFDEYKEGTIDQHSVGMFYSKIELAVRDEDYPEENKVWKKYINLIGNKEKAENKGYFYAVSEAKLIEISAVLEGSNELTPTVEAKNIEPPKDTQETEPPKSTQKISRYYY